MVKENFLELLREGRFALWGLGPVFQPVRAECAVWGGKNEAFLCVLNFEVFEGFNSGPPEQVEITRFRG